AQKLEKISKQTSPFPKRLLLTHTRSHSSPTSKRSFYVIENNQIIFFGFPQLTYQRFHKK
ncbi:20108_t:CDS:1, partial [Gigaspora rosea]